MSATAHESGILIAGTGDPLHALLDGKALSTPDALAYRFLADGESEEHSLTYRNLAQRSRLIAGGLMRRGAQGKAIVLAEPPGLDFIAGLFACWHAGSIAIPAYPPRGSRHRQRFQSILADSAATLILGSGIEKSAGLQVLETQQLLDEGEPLVGPALRSDGPCLLQYTSGSTSTPKGVMLDHSHFRQHFASLAVYDSLKLKSSLSWLPPYHDMGLVLKILHAFEAGIPLTFFAPDHFIRKPSRWLRSISHYRAEFSGGPNFALDVCSRMIRDEELEGLDLSCWKALPLGAERIRPETLDRFTKRFAPYGFNPDAYLPGFGLAETTLIATACQSRGSARVLAHRNFGKLVSNGPPLPGVEVRIVEPGTDRDLPPGEQGEIIVHGPIVSGGYWNQAGPFLSNNGFRTGDLGFLDGGELFVSGRIKDVIIIDGVNHSPEDIEGAAIDSMDSIHTAAAFSGDHDGREVITLCIELTGIKADHFEEVCSELRKNIANLLEIPLHRIVIIRAGLTPRTTSGKIRRAACREALANGTLKPEFVDEACAESHAPILEILLDAAREVTCRAVIHAGDSLIAHGMGSLDATRLAALVRSRTGLDVSVAEIFAANSFDELSQTISAKRPCESRLGQIKPGSGDHSNAMTHAQERMWFLHQIDPSSAAYHVFGAVELTGQLSTAELNRAFGIVVSRHDILRSRHGFEDGRPLIRIEKHVPTLEVSPEFDDAGINQALAAFARKPFNLAEDSPIRASLFPCGSNRHLLAVSAHHIAVDGWSMRLLAAELAAAYSGKPASSTPAFSYLDYAFHHRRWVDSGAVDPQIHYWKEHLSGHPGQLQLPTDFPRPHRTSSEGGLAVRILPDHLCKRIAEIAIAHRATPFMLHLAAFLLLLRQHGASPDAVVAIPVANRNHAAASNLVGTLVNTLPFRLATNLDDSFETLLERVREASFAMQANQDAPFERIIEVIKVQRSGDQAPLAQVMFDHQEIPIAETWTDGLTCKPYITHRGAAQFDLSLLLTAFSDHQQLSIEYRSDLYRHQTIEDMLDRSVSMLHRIAAQPSMTVAEAIKPTKVDRDWLANVSFGPQRPGFTGRTTPELIAARAAIHPHRTAVVCGGESMIYHEVAMRSDALAHSLRRLGVGTGDRVAVMLERDQNLPTALLAIWKSGAAYVPLDRANPAERLGLILNDQSPIKILVSPRLAQHLPSHVKPIVFDESMMLEQENSPKLPDIKSSDSAYIIYTSGSTGQPKGVVVSHGALANFLLAMAESPGFTEADHLLAVTTISFDISTLELFLPLTSGGSLELASTAVARDGHALLASLRTSRATVMQATPATWRLLIDSGWTGSPDLKILCGGEALDLQLASQLVKMGCQLWNLYGPTETTVWSTCWRVPDKPDCIRIGKPIANTGIHILAEDGNVLPPGVPGQLWISGSGLAEGYWKKEDLTKERFVSMKMDERELLAYHTGDIARWHADGQIECLGRSDGQIKIRGFRVESGEIEAALASHPDVSQARVALRDSPQSGGRLIAWITCKPGKSPPNPADLRNHLSSRLPDYMIPAEIGHIDAFPLNSSGKVDLTKLADPEAIKRFDEPVTENEAKLMGLWCELLGRSAVHADDNWFHIGGHSLLALRMFARIHQDFNRRLPLSAILDHSTPRALAAILEKSPPDTF
jgi:amino acid adenylation domain-containing protein